MESNLSPPPGAMSFAPPGAAPSPAAGEGVGLTPPVAAATAAAMGPAPSVTLDTSQQAPHNPASPAGSLLAGKYSSVGALEAAYLELLSLPMFPTLSDADQERSIESLFRALEGRAS